jgi:hypothetical protein
MGALIRAIRALMGAIMWDTTGVNQGPKEEGILGGSAPAPILQVLRRENPASIHFSPLQGCWPLRCRHFLVSSIFCILKWADFSKSIKNSLAFEV